MSLMRPIIEEALTAPPEHLYKQQSRLGHVTLKRALIDCHHWQEVEHINVYDSDLVEPWSPALALERLGVTQVPYDAPDSTWDAYSRGREFAVAENVADPLRAVLHELGHITLRHTFVDPNRPSRPIREVQAEVVAFGSLVMMGAIEGQLLGSSRRYIARWLNKAEEPLTDDRLEATAKAIETIFAAGR